MKQEQGFFHGARNALLYFQRWSPDSPPRALVVVVHGLGEHGGRYAEMAGVLVSAGYAVATLDLRGHGRSSGQRGFVRAWTDFRDDLASFLDQQTALWPGISVFLLGHSLGGVISLDFALNRPALLSGLILSAPALHETTVGPMLWSLAWILNHILPRFSVRVLSDDEKNTAGKTTPPFKDDPLTHSRGTARLAMELRKTVKRIRRQEGQIRLPLLLLHAEGDLTVSIEGARELFDQVGTADKEFRSYPGDGHELFLDSLHEQVLDDVIRWLGRHGNRQETVAN